MPNTHTYSKASLILVLISAHHLTYAAEPSSAESATNWQHAIQAGPTDISLLNQAVLHLPANYSFVPAKEASELLQSMGNQTGTELQGMILPTESDKNWFITLSYSAVGYIKDDDARDWDADELLDNIRSSTNEGNQERRNRGIPELDIVGWVQKPQYYAGDHHLIWSIASHTRGEPESAVEGINYKTLALGREGFISLNLVTSRDLVSELKPVAAELAQELKFNPGKAYNDFNASTDMVAEYGLAALVAGVAAKKLGLLAVVGAFLLKFAKVIIIGVAVGVAALRKRLKGRSLT